MVPVEISRIPVLDLLHQPPGGHVITILLVDDMKHFLNLERSFLKRSDCRIVTATTGLEAIKVARAVLPDVVLLDVEMPEMNGIEATRILKNLPETRSIPIVIISSLSVRDEALQAGANDFHQKPIDEDGFLALVQNHVHLPIRRESRLVVDIPAHFYLNEQKWPGTIRDLSLHGCQMEAVYRPPLGELILLDFQLSRNSNSKQIRQEAYIVRETLGGFGCSFHEVSTGTELFLDEFMNPESPGGE